MPAQSGMVGFLLFGGTAVVLLAVLIYLGRLKYQAMRSKRKIALVSEVLIDYFRKAGVEVASARQPI